MTPELTIAYLTVNRREGIEYCLDHVFDTVGRDFECVVVDSTPGPIEDKYDDWDVGVVSPPVMVGPAEAQKIAVDACQTDRLLLLADDVTPREGTVDQLAGVVGGGDADIATGVAVDEDGPRTTGRKYFTTEIHGRPIVGKQPIDRDAPGPIDVHEGDILMADMSVFDEVSFDARFQFHLDMWDFFMYCLSAGVGVKAVPSAKFDHHDFEYDAPTKRDFEDKWGAAAYFNGKWGYWPSYVGSGDFDEEPPMTVEWLSRGDLQ